MTKVIISPSILAYRQAMAQLVDQVCDENMIVDEDRQRPEELREFRTEVPELWMPGLLGSPTIEALWPDLVLKNGHLDGLIQINTSERAHLHCGGASARLDRERVSRQSLEAIVNSLLSSGTGLAKPAKL